MGSWASRRVIAILLEVCLVGLAALISLSTFPAGQGSLPDPFRLGFLVVLVLLSSRFVVRLDRGSLRLTMIATAAAALTLTPPWAAVIGALAGWLRKPLPPVGAL